jgi:hypothetical protein
MAAGADQDRDLASLVVPAAGAVVARDDLWEPVWLIDGDGEPVGSVRAFLKELQASGRSAATQRSYAMDLLRWFRFGWASALGGTGDPGWVPNPAVSAKDTGLRNLPFHHMAQNRIWVAISALAQDLLAWCARLALPGRRLRAETTAAT